MQPPGAPRCPDWHRRSATRPDPQPTAASLTARERALLAGPTQGDLAGERAYLGAVDAAWQRSHRSSQNAGRGIFDHMLGRPTVAWAGTTPVGPAAYVVQAADLRNHADVQLDHEGPALLWGFVGPDRAGDPTVVWDAAGSGSRPVFPVGDRPAAAWPAGRLPGEGPASAALGSGTQAGQADVSATAGTIGDSLWFAAGRTPDGRRLVAGELSFDDDPTRVYAVVGTGPRAVVSSAPVRHAAPVPVVLRLPADQSWLVAAKGTTFTWSEPGGPRSAPDAALVPAGVTDLRADGTPVALS